MINNFVRWMLGKEPFLDSDRYTYAKIGNILTTQLARLTIAEKLLIYCLAIRREPLSIDVLAEHFAPLDLDRSLPSTIDSLIERSFNRSVLTQQLPPNLLKLNVIPCKRTAVQIAEFISIQSPQGGHMLY